MTELQQLVDAYQNTLGKFENDIDKMSRLTADYMLEVAGHGEYSERGATLSRADFEDARANL